MPCERYKDSSIKFYVGDRTKAFLKARDICGMEELVSLSRDNGIFPKLVDFAF